MIKRKIFFSLFLLTFMKTPLLLAAVTSVNPATSEEEIVLIPAEKERSMGKNIHKNVLEHYKEPVDPLQQKRAEEIGVRLANGTDRKDIVYRFTVLNDKEKEDNYNAFAAPGGYIYIFDDLVTELESDEKIAGVLAHEMGHVEAKHSLKRFQGNIGMLLLIIASTQAKGVKGDYTNLNQAIGQLMASYSRHDETQADELSIKYMKRAGYDVQGAVGALKKLQELRKKAPRMRYFAYKTHPYLSERIAHMQIKIKGFSDFDSYINMATEDE